MKFIGRADLRKAAEVEIGAGTNLLAEFDCKVGVPPRAVTAEAAAATAEAAATAAAVTSKAVTAETAAAEPKVQLHVCCHANHCIPLGARAHGVPVAKGRCIWRSIAVKWLGKLGAMRWHASHVPSSGQATGHVMSNGLRQPQWQLVGK